MEMFLERLLIAIRGVVKHLRYQLLQAIKTFELKCPYFCKIKAKPFKWTVVAQFASEEPTNIVLNFKLQQNKTGFFIEYQSDDVAEIEFVKL